MGTDIHLHIEVKVADEWHHYACSSISRDYRLFGKMAGVSIDNNPISDPKGIPENLSQVTYISLREWGVDAHTVSWFNLEEIGILETWVSDSLKQDLEYDILGKIYLFGNSFYGLKKYPDEYPSDLQDVRFVFWFDN